ncbi:MAG: DUF882 domain-containing protein [Polyangiales bacterium]
MSLSPLTRLTTLARARAAALAPILCALAAGALTTIALPSIAATASASGMATHTLKKGETLESVAKKFGVSSKSILTASKLKDPSAIKVGTKLTIPPKSAATAPKKDLYELKPSHAGRASFTRLGSHETLALQLTKKGKVVPGVLPRMSKLMRFGPSGLEHAIEGRLVTQLAQVSDHFGGRTFEIVSGFRPKTPTQHTAHSNHNLGRAMDFRIPGVPNEVLRDYCRTFKKSGVGYYPNSLFVHFDVRDESAYWIDISKPGEAPRYVSATGAPLKKAPDADHTADEVSGDMDLPTEPEKTPTSEPATSAAPAASTAPAPTPAASASAK